MQNRLPLVISVAALVVAVLGTTPLGQAAYNSVVPANSVGAIQLRNASVTEAKLRGDAVTSGKVKDHSLKAKDFADGQIPVGPQGPKGDKGDKGSKGSAGATNVVVRRAVGGTTPSGGSGVFFDQANCEPGEHAVGGGAGIVTGDGSYKFHVSSSTPWPNTPGVTPTGWRGGIFYEAGGIKWSVWVICTKP
jgi:hypothetical protein